MSKDLEKIKIKLKNLKQNKDLSDSELDLLAQNELEKRMITDSLTLCVNEDEKEFARNLLDRYLSQSSFENEADKDTLKQLIDLEIFVERIKKQLNSEYNKANPAIPMQLVEQMQSLNNQVLQFKEKLNLTSTDKSKSEWQETWDLLRKKAVTYFEEHKGCNTVRCPYCNKLFHLLLKLTNYEAIKSTWFKGTVLYNKKVFYLYHSKKLTKEECAEILGCSIYYIDFLYDNLYLKEQNDS